MNDEYIPGSMAEAYEAWQKDLTNEELKQKFLKLKYDCECHWFQDYGMEFI